MTGIISSPITSVFLCQEYCVADAIYKFSVRDITPITFLAKDVVVATSDPPYTQKSSIIHINCTVDVF
jgi:hypothetical protein